ncbi:GntR family transcriptional regulator [Glutamicibacter sp.]|uniref:GntR family transcriptional regulator n=1 Tax=Glutamicibacter sp. TaxID=1931995 RepID=UPI0028BD2926|nr:GntR family transcriptional regulator [Glutamicibacter sp.]
MSQIKNQPKHQVLAEELRTHIASGRWAEGAALPSEAELCLQSNASRGTVRHALATLRAEGLIAGGQGKPPVVAHAVKSQSFSTFMSFTEWAQSMGQEPGQRTIELAKRPADAQVAGHLHVDEASMVVQVLRLRLLDGTPAMIERSSFEAEAGRLLFDFDTDSGSIFRYLREQGVDLARGRHIIDAVAADAKDSELLGIAEGTPLLRERRITSTSTGEVVEYSDDRYLPQLANFTIENTSEHRAALSRVPSAVA